MSAQLSHNLSLQGTWTGVLQSGIAQFLALTVVRRGASLILPSNAPHFALESPSTFAFGYAAADVYKTLGTGSAGFKGFLLVLFAVANFGLIIANAFTLSRLTALGIKSTSTVFPALSLPTALNLLPFVAAAIHALENLVFLLVLTVSRSDFLAGLAGTLGFARDVVGLACVGVVAATVPVALYEWAMSIGRDGRQKVANYPVNAKRQ
ncbi:hypothetical protein HKX48_008434 [Thoreauomyces humboldtii]|nr:hypothetical protein HKX48_008434 [Thoreauomyces humboldtii]